MNYDFDTIINRHNSGSTKWDAIKQTMGEGGEDILALSVADMEFKVAPEITKAVMEQAAQGVYGYTGAKDSYFPAVAAWMQRRYNWQIKKEWLSYAPGIVPALFTAVRAYTHPGDKVIIQTPVYYPFRRAIVQNGCEAVENKLIYNDGRYTMDYDGLAEQLQDPRVRLLILCSPHNPVGRVWSHDELARVGELCRANGVLVIADEIHADFVYKPHKHIVFATLSESDRDNCVIMTAPSKTFNLAGLQCSNIIIPNPRLKAEFDIAQANTGFYTLNHFAFVSCEAAYNHGETWLDEMLQHLEGNIKYVRDFIAAELPRVKMSTIEGTYLVWLDCRDYGYDKIELEKRIKEKGRLFLNEGYIFGDNGAGFERINIACPRAMLEQGMRRIKTALEA